jgi:hypothetical protein
VWARGPAVQPHELSRSYSSRTARYSLRHGGNARSAYGDAGLYSIYCHFIEYGILAASTLSLAHGNQ